MPSAVYLHDGEKQITVRFPTEEDRERFKTHYRAIDALAMRYRTALAQIVEHDLDASEMYDVAYAALTGNRQDSPIDPAERVSDNADSGPTLTKE